MNKYSTVSLFLLLAATSYANAAADNFDSNTNILTIPAVSVGTSNYSNVAVRLDNYTVLGFTPTSSVDGAVFEAPLVKMVIKGFSRGQPDSSGNSTVTFSIVITNKAPNKIGIGRASQIKSDIASVLVSEKGEACNADNLKISGLMDLPDSVLKDTPPQFLDTHPTSAKIDDFEVIDVGGSKQISVASSSGCAFTGSSVSFYSTLVVFDAASQTWQQQPYSFVDQPMPIPFATASTVANPNSCASGGLTAASYNFIGQGMTLAQVSQIIGFSYDTSTVYKTPTATTYVWHDATKYIYVSFDSSGHVLSKQAMRL